jgi:hypothetical protein
MSIHGLLQEPASYPSNFITLPFTIPPTSQNYGQQTFQAIVRTVTASGGVPTMTAGDDFEQTEFDLGINVMLSNITVTLHLDDAVNYNNVSGFGMIAWDYSSITSRIFIQTYNFGAASITNWRIEVIAFPITQGGLWPLSRATDQNTSQSLFLGTPISPTPTAAWNYQQPPFSFNDNTITIGSNGYLYISEDAGNLVALADSGSAATLLWSFPTGYTALTSPALGLDNTLYLGGSNSLTKLIEIDTINPFQIWTANLTPLNNPFPPLISYSSTLQPTVYVGGTNGKVYALLDLGSSFSYKWTFSVPGGNMFLALSLDGTVLYISNQQVLYAVDTVTGLQKWSRAIGASTLSPPSIGVDGTIYVFQGTSVFAVTNNGTTSTLKWTLAIGGATSNLFRNISIGGNYDRLYLVTNTQIVAVTDNGASGTTDWVFTVNPALAPGLLRTPTISLDGSIYITGDYSVFLCLTDNGTTATQNWGFQIGGGLAAQPSIGVFKRLYFGDDQNGIYAY